MKTATLTLLLIPFLSIGQLSNKDKRSIDNHAISACDCMNNLMDSLHPKTVDIILLMAEKGEDEAVKNVELMLAEMSPEEMNEFLESFSTIESEEFGQKITDCDDTDSLKGNLKEQTNDADSEAFAYLMEVLDRDENCRVLKALFDIGKSE